MGTYRMTVGDITCMAVQEGATTFDLSTINNRYPNATESEIQDAITKLGIQGDSVGHYFNALYIEVDGTKILVDAGMGQNPDRPQIGQIIPNLQAEGIHPEDIDIVYITHFHGDHYMGLLSNGEATFPNARYLTQDSEWNYWTSDETARKLGDRVQGILNVINPLRDKFSSVKAGEEIVTGVKVVDLPGHTPGQSGLLIESGDDAFLHLVDLLHHEAQFIYPDWQFVWDTDGDLATRTRRTQLGNAATRNLQVMFYHLPFPGIGTVKREGTHFKWMPVGA